MEAHVHALHWTFCEPDQNSEGLCNDIDELFWSREFPTSFILIKGFSTASNLNGFPTKFHMKDFHNLQQVISNKFDIRIFHTAHDSTLDFSKKLRSFIHSWLELFDPQNLSQWQTDKTCNTSIQFIWHRDRKDWHLATAITTHMIVFAFSVPYGLNIAATLPVIKFIQGVKFRLPINPLHLTLEYTLLN